MRIGYSEDEDFPGQFALYQANCRRSIKGKEGQAVLRELEQALLALPAKRLIADELRNAEGEVRAVGALAKYRGVEKTEADPEDMEEVGVELGMPRLVAWKVVCLNDIELGGYGYGLVSVTPEERYVKVLEWVRRQIGQAI
jgi:hypothetical protein